MDQGVFENQTSFLTLKIKTEYSDNTVGFGTGFLFQFPSNDNVSKVFVLITNRHVLEGSTYFSIKFNRRDAEGLPDYRNHHTVRFSTSQYGYLSHHPDPNVDLCAVAIQPALNEVEKTGNRAYIKAFSPSQIINNTNRLSFTAIENVIMVGYPNGLSDELNNIPIVRRGITASPIYLDHEGRPDFVIDAPCFPGSSGSPIMIYDRGCYIDGEAKFGTRVLLAGILYAGPFLRANGSFQKKAIPTKQLKADEIQMMINLGFCIQAEKILDFIPIIRSWGADV